MRRFIDVSLVGAAVYKLPPEFMSSGDENAKGLRDFWQRDRQEQD
jgi:hypothetical protein